jgi:ATP/maltotriose-dependent transcriptional regulator MalT
MIHMGGEMELDAEDYAIALKAAQSDTYDYLQNAVFVKLSPRVQKAVAMMGGAASVPARLFDAYVVAEEKSALAVLLKYNPMNDTYDAQPPAEEFLRAKFEALSEESVRRGWHLLANWYAERSAPAMAARYYVKARDWAAVRGVILTMPITMSDATAQYFLDAVREAIESGGEEASADYSFLKNALYPRLLYSLRRNDEAEAAAVAANKWLERCGQPYAHFQIMLNYAIIGMARLRRMLVTDREDCMDYFKKAHDEFLRCPPETIMPLKLCSQAVLNTYVCYIGANAKPGALERCFAIADNVIQYLSEPLGGFLYGVEELVRAEAAYYLGNLDEAKIRAASAITKASEKGQYDVIAHAKGYLAAIHIAEGDAKEVLSIMRWYDEIVNNTQYYNRSSARDYYISWLFAHLGLPELVCDWIKNSVIPQNSHLRELDVRTRSAYLMDNGEWESALAVLNTNLPPTQIYLLYAVSIEVYKAWCYMELGDALRATEALKKVYHLAAPHQIVMQFIRCGAATVRLLDKYRQAAGIPADWATDISERAALYEKRKAFVAKAVRKFYGDGQETVKLTRREAAVLKDLCCDMTYAEIAASQGVSVNAIKQAQKSLYMKLDVSSRAEAVRMAQQERLV